MEQLCHRKTGTPERYLVTLAGLGSGCCLPGGAVHGSHPCMVEVDQKEGCRLVCGDPGCTLDHKFISTASFLRNRSMLFTVASHAMPVVTKQAWNDPVQSTIIMERLVEMCTRRQPPLAKKQRVA